MASVVDFLNAQPPDVYRFIFDSVHAYWRDSAIDVHELIKQRYPGVYSEEEIAQLVYAAMVITR